MGGYEIRSHAELGDVLQDIVALARIAFGNYDGVIAVDEEFLQWYLTRPGMTPESRFAAVRDGRVVSNAFVTIEKVQFGGTRLDVGMVDTVMTHPDHRRRGLARRVLERALAFMRDRGLDASQLYTAADSMPQRFYKTLGYHEHVRVRYYALNEKQRVNLLSALRREGMGGGKDALIRRCGSGDVPAVRRFLDESFREYDGYMPVHNELWAWRREQRPLSLPVTTHLALDGNSQIEGAAALASAPLRKGAGIEVMTGVLDFTVKDWRIAPEFFQYLVLNAGDRGSLIATSGIANARFNRLCESFGFACFALEVSMLNAFSAKARKVTGRGPILWYTATESLIGI